MVLWFLTKDTGPFMWSKRSFKIWILSNLPLWFPMSIFHLPLRTPIFWPRAHALSCFRFFFFFKAFLLSCSSSAPCSPVSFYASPIGRLPLSPLTCVTCPLFTPTAPSLYFKLGRSILFFTYSLMVAFPIRVCPVHLTQCVIPGRVPLDIYWMTKWMSSP